MGPIDKRAAGITSTNSKYPSEKLVSFVDVKSTIQEQIYQGLPLPHAEEFVDKRTQCDPCVYVNSCARSAIESHSSKPRTVIESRLEVPVMRSRREKDQFDGEESQAQPSQTPFPAYSKTKPSVIDDGGLAVVGRGDEASVS